MAILTSPIRCQKRNNIQTSKQTRMTAGKAENSTLSPIPSCNTCSHRSEDIAYLCSCSVHFNTHCDLYSGGMCYLIFSFYRACWRAGDTLNTTWVGWMTTGTSVHVLLPLQKVAAVKSSAGSQPPAASVTKRIARHSPSITSRGYWTRLPNLS